MAEETGAKITRRMQTDKPALMVQTTEDQTLLYSAEVELEGMK